MGIEIKTDMKDLDNYVLKIANNMEDDTKKVLKRLGKGLRKSIKQVARASVGSVKRNGAKKSYHNRFKVSKPFKLNNGDYTVSVVNTSPHAHLLEYGHRIVRRGTRTFTGRYAPAYHIMEIGKINYYNRNLDNDLDEIMGDFL